MAPHQRPFLHKDMLLVLNLQLLYADSVQKLLTQVQGTIQFEDDEKISNWAKESVHALASLGVIQGTSQSNFEPQREVSFEQMLVLSYRCFSIFKT